MGKDNNYERLTCKWTDGRTNGRSDRGHTNRTNRNKAWLFGMPPAMVAKRHRAVSTGDEDDDAS